MNWDTFDFNSQEDVLIVKGLVLILLFKNVLDVIDWVYWSNPFKEILSAVLLSSSSNWRTFSSKISWNIPLKLGKFDFMPTQSNSLF